MAPECTSSMAKQCTSTKKSSPCYKFGSADRDEIDKLYLSKVCRSFFFKTKQNKKELMQKKMKRWHFPPEYFKLPPPTNTSLCIPVVLSLSLFLFCFSLSLFLLFLFLFCFIVICCIKGKIYCQMFSILFHLFLIFKNMTRAFPPSLQLLFSIITFLNYHLSQ